VAGAGADFFGSSTFFGGAYVVVLAGAATVLAGAGALVSFPLATTFSGAFAVFAVTGAFVSGFFSASCSLVASLCF